MKRVGACVVATAALVLTLAGCGGDAPRISPRTGATTPGTSPAAPAPSATPTPVPTPTSPVPVADPSTLDFGRLLLGRAVTATVTVWPGRRPVRLGATELRGSPAYDVTSDTCSGRVLSVDTGACRIGVTVLTRATGVVAARLVLPTGSGAAPVVVRLTGTAPLSYTLTLTLRGEGLVAAESVGLSCSRSCTARIPRGASLVLTASPAPRWGGACAAGTAPTCRVTVTAPLQVSVDFGAG